MTSYQVINLITQIIYEEVNSKYEAFLLLEKYIKKYPSYALGVIKVL